MQWALYLIWTKINLFPSLLTFQSIKGQDCTEELPALIYKIDLKNLT